MHKSILYFLFVVALLAACSDVSEQDRLVYVRPANVNRTVLVEDFTGQRCVWCPSGNDAIAAMEQQYGDTAVIAVAIHSGPLGFRGSATVLGLATELGDSYYQRFGVESQPTALVNRKSLLPRVTDWPDAVRSALEGASPVMLTLTSGFDSLTRRATVQAEILALDDDVSGHLQVWLTQDSIRALQAMPDGTYQYDYVHNHVLRAAVNGDWGETVSIPARQSASHTYSITLPEDYVARHCHFVAFVYDDGGVLQAAQVPVAASTYVKLPVITQ